MSKKLEHEDILLEPWVCGKLLATFEGAAMDFFDVLRKGLAIVTLVVRFSAHFMPLTNCNFLIRWRSSIVAWRVLLKFACKLLHALNHALIFWTAGFNRRGFPSHGMHFSVSASTLQDALLVAPKSPRPWHLANELRTMTKTAKGTAWVRWWQGPHADTKSCHSDTWMNLWRGRKRATHPWQESLKHPYAHWKSKWNLFWLELFIWCKLVPSNVLTRQAFSRSSSATSPLDFFNLGASQANCIERAWQVESGKGSGPGKTGGAWGTEDGHTVTGNRWQAQKVEKVKVEKEVEKVEKPKRKAAKATKPSPKDLKLAQNSQVVR